MVPGHYLSEEFFSWFQQCFSEKLNEKSYSLYLHYSSGFSQFIQKDFFAYTKQDADYYCSVLRSHVDEKFLKPKSVYNEIGILSSIARELEATRGIPDYFSEQERPKIEYQPLSQKSLPSTKELDLILSAAADYDPSGTMQAALFLIGVYALSRAEIIMLSTENVFIQDNSLAIKRKECNVNGVVLPKLILLDTVTYDRLLPFYERMRKKAEESDSNTEIFFFTDSKGKPFKPHSFSYAYRCILESTNLNYTLRDLRSGALTRIAHIGGSDALFGTAGLRSVWGERYVQASKMLSSDSPFEHSVNAYDNFIMLPKDNLSTLLETCYHAFQRIAATKKAVIHMVDGKATADITLDENKYIRIDENGTVVENNIQ